MQAVCLYGGHVCVWGEGVVVFEDVVIYLHKFRQNNMKGDQVNKLV